METQLEKERGPVIYTHHSYVAQLATSPGLIRVWSVGGLGPVLGDLGFWRGLLGGRLIWNFFEEPRRVVVVAPADAVIRVKAGVARRHGCRQWVQLESMGLYMVAVIQRDPMHLMDDGEVSDRGSFDPESIRERVEVDPQTDTDVIGISPVSMVGLQPALYLLPWVCGQRWVMDNGLNQGIFDLLDGQAPWERRRHLDAFQLPGLPAWSLWVHPLGTGRAHADIVLKKVCWSTAVDPTFIKVA